MNGTFSVRDQAREMKNFAVDLKRSATCKFEAFLDQALCMQFVVGLNMPKVQSRLMQESTLAIDAAVKVVIAESSAATSCAIIDSSFQGGGGARKAEQPSIASTTRGEQTSRNGKMCWRSGTHNPGNCRFKTKSCHKYKSVEHIQKCRTHTNVPDTYKSVGHIQKRCDAVAKWRAANLTKKSTKSSVHSVREQTADYVSIGRHTSRGRYSAQQRR